MIRSSTAPIVAAMMPATIPEPRWIPTRGNSQLPIKAPIMPMQRSATRPKPVPLTIWPASQPAINQISKMTSKLSPDMVSSEARMNLPKTDQARALTASRRGVNRQNELSHASGLDGGQDPSDEPRRDHLACAREEAHAEPNADLIEVDGGGHVGFSPACCGAQFGSDRR